MNRHSIIGFALVGVAGLLTCVFASTDGGWARDLLGKAVWCLPYAAFVCGVRTLVMPRG